MIVRVALLASLAFAVPALAADPVPVAKDDSEKVVCRSDVGTGSIIPRKTCHTKAQWQTIDRDNQDATDDAGRDDTEPRPATSVSKYAKGGRPRRKRRSTAPVALHNLR